MISGKQKNHTLQAIGPRPDPFESWDRCLSRVVGWCEAGLTDLDGSDIVALAVLTYVN